MGCIWLLLATTFLYYTWTASFKATLAWRWINVSASKKKYSLEMDQRAHDNGILRRYRLHNIIPTFKKKGVCQYVATYDYRLKMRNKDVFEKKRMRLIG